MYVSMYCVPAKLSKRIEYLSLVSLCICLFVFLKKELQGYDIDYHAKTLSDNTIVFRL